MKNLAIILLAGGISFIAVSQENKKHSSELKNVSQKISKAPDNIIYYHNRAEVYDKMNEFANANRDYNTVLKLYRSHPDPDFALYYAKASYRLADDHYYRKSNDKQALKYVSEGLNVYPGYKDLEILEAVILANNKDNRHQASKKFEAAVSKYPNDVTLSKHYAQFLEEFDPMGAAEQYEKVIDVEPYNSTVLLSLGTIYNNEAVRLSATVSDPEEVNALTKKAVGYFEKAYALNPGDAELENILTQLKEELSPMGENEKENVPF